MRQAAGSGRDPAWKRPNMMNEEPNEKSKEESRKETQKETKKESQKETQTGNARNKRRTGEHYEQLAGRWLEQHGYSILAYNVRCRSGEVDIVAREQETLSFIEVKYRRSQSFGDPAEAVTKRKQSSICRVALWYCRRFGVGTDVPVRFDIVAITGNRIRLIRNAFAFCIAG